jgi:hypothetical protein
MRNLAIFVFFVVAIIYLITPSDSASVADAADDAAGVGAAETFTWQGEQPIAFKPPMGWQAGRYQQGRRNGVDYIKHGQRIAVTEYTKVGQLDGCAKMQEVLTELGTVDNKILRQKLRSAVRHPKSVSNPTAARLLEGVKEYLDGALKSLADDNLTVVRSEIDGALRSRFSSGLSLEDYLHEVTYKQTVRGDIKRVAIELPDKLLVGGEPAVSVDYEVDIRAQYATGIMEKTEAGREAYVMSSNRLFLPDRRRTTAGAQGLNET